MQAGTAGLPQIITEQTNSHVRLRSSPLRFPVDGHQVFFDDGHDFVVTFDGADVHAYSLLTGQKARSVRYNLASRLDSIRFSPNLSFIMVKRHTNLVELVNCLTGETISVTCKSSQKGNVIIGCVWTGGECGDFALITHHGIEMFKLNARADAAKSFKTVKGIAHINWFVYNHSLRCALVCTGPRKAAVQAIQFCSSGPIKMPKFEPNQSSSDSRPLALQDFTICKLYNKLCCLFISPARQEMLVFQMGREAVGQRCSCSLFTVGETFAVSVLDSLVAVHTLGDKYTILFDINVQENGIAKPLAPPLPIGGPRTIEDPNSLIATSKPAAHYLRDWCFSSPDLIIDKVQGKAWELTLQLDNLASSMRNEVHALQFLLQRENSATIALKLLRETVTNKAGSPEIVFKLFSVVNQSLASNIKRMKQNEMSNTKSQGTSGKWFFWEPMEEEIKRRRVSVAVEPGSSASSSGSTSPTVAASDGRSNMRQTNATAVTAGAEMPSGGRGGTQIGDGAGILDGLFRGGGYLEMLGVEEAGLRPALMASSDGSSGPSNRTIIDQSAMLQHVFMPLHISKALPSDILTNLITEYIRSLLRYDMPVNQFTLESLAQICLECVPPRFHLLHQLVQYNILMPSKVVARQLLSVDDQFAGAQQLALDMLKRLGAHEDVVMVMLDRRQIRAALQYYRNNKVFRISPSLFLKSSLTFEDERVFFTTFKFLQSLNESRRGTAAFKPEDNCAEYVTRFRSKYGASVDV